jgi:hypothetical protein
MLLKNYGDIAAVDTLCVYVYIYIYIYIYKLMYIHAQQIRLNPHKKLVEDPLLPSFPTEQDPD